MRVVLDRFALQSRVHFDDGVRLASFIAALAQEAEVAFVGPLLPEALADADVLVIPTRSLAEPNAGPTLTSGRPYADSEIDAVTAFVHRGRGLLLMTNHGDVPGRAPDHTEQDARLAACFGVTIERACFSSDAGPSKLVTMPGGHHPVLDGVRTVVTMTSTSILADQGIPLVPLEPAMTDRRGGLDPHGRFFAVAVTGIGRVMVVGNSGFIGTRGTRKPNHGLFAEGDNGRFVVNAVRWLAATEEIG